MAVAVMAAKALLAVSIACGSAPDASVKYTVCAVKAYHGVTDTIESCEVEMRRRGSEDGAFFLREGLRNVGITAVCADGPLTPETLKGIERVATDAFKADKIKTRHYNVKPDGAVLATTPTGFPK